jgi:Zn-dependent protease with chaperone function
MLGNSGVCSVAVELPDVKREDHFLIWALQVAGSTAGAPNAYAQSSNNRIVINKALDLAFAEDLEAKACVLAHEMAHLQQDHTKQMKKALAEWNTEAAGKITGAVRNAHSAKSNNQFWSALAMVANAASADYSIGGQVLIQLEAVITTIVWSGVVSFIGFKVVDALVGLRVSEEDEREGLDISSHGETAYHR